MEDKHPSNYCLCCDCSLAREQLQQAKLARQTIPVKTIEQIEPTGLDALVGLSRGEVWEWHLSPSYWVTVTRVDALRASAYVDSDTRWRRKTEAVEEVYGYACTD